MAGAIEIRCEANDFGRFAESTRGWDRTLKDGLRRELGPEARSTARAASRAALALRNPGLPPSVHPQVHRSTGMRARIAASVKVSTLEGEGVGYEIKATDRMAAPTNSPTRFRHPVFGGFGHRGGVDQATQPWWTSSIYRSRSSMARAADRALDWAIRRLR